jgi:hypothetical protein
MQPANGAYYEWPVPGVPFAIHLSFDVIDRIEADIAGRGARGGAEVGGALFGRLAQGGTALYIDGYEPVACEHSRGSAWRLSATDRKRLERALRKGPVAGFYRSHMRPGLYLDQDDYTLIESCFSNPNDVFLLVRPRADQPAAAGFFFWEEDSIHRHSTYLEFPFRTSALRAPDAVGEPSSSVRRMGAGGLAVVAATLALMGVWAVEHPVRLGGGPARRVEADSAPALSVERNGTYLQVAWDASAPAVACAADGILRITDGSIHKELHLDRAQLRAASVAYAPLGNEVTFELDLAGGKIAVSETFRLEEAPRQRTPVVQAGTAKPKVLGN